MKSLKVVFAFALISVFTLAANAQTENQKKTSSAPSVSESFKVLGNCGMCKTRIENAAKEEGASAATWDSKTRLLTVSFDPAKTSREKLEKKMAAVGHDTEKFRAPDDVYAKLPGCCHYERAK